MHALIGRSALAVRSLADATSRIEAAAPLQEIALACERGYFRPLEEERLIRWFAHLLTARDALWEVLFELSEEVQPVGLEHLELERDRRLFLIGYVAACLVVRLDRLLVEQVALDSICQRKLNEGSLELRVPRKQFTAVWESLSRPNNALRMRAAMKLADRERAKLRAFAGDPELGDLVDRLAWLEEPLDPSKSRYLELLLDYGDHALRRWGASTTQKATFGVLESSGRLVAELRDHWSSKRIAPETVEQLAALLEPGDVLATRHDVAMSNLFLPGYWPHSALYVGKSGDRERLGIVVDEEVSRVWHGDRRVLEALKDGVHFRPIAETLSVDAVAVLRPRLEPSEIARAIERVAPHQGKMYNFDFDFFRSDRLVCTEVVYRAFDGPLDIALRERAGRPTLSAEDLLDLAFDDGPFEVVAISGSPGCEGRLLLGDEAREALAASYRATDRAP